MRKRIRNQILATFDYFADRDNMADLDRWEDAYTETLDFFSDPAVISKMKPESVPAYIEYINSYDFKRVVADEWNKCTF